MKVLLAEDEEQLSHVTATAMRSVGYQVDVALNGKIAVELANQNAYDVMIFDIMMPIMNGVDALKQIRKSGDKTYVIMLTAMAEIDDKVRGLDAGADDYLTKPFSLKELLARLRSLERRTENYSTKMLQVGNVILNMSEQELISKNTIRLSSKEVELMQYFMLNQGKEISTQEIYTHVWKDDAENDESIVWIYVSYLRSKLESVLANIVINGEKDGNFTLDVM